MEEQSVPQSSLEASPNSSPNKNTTLIILLVILFLIASGTAGYAIYQNSQLKKQTGISLGPQQSQPTLSFNNTPTLSPKPKNTIKDFEKELLWVFYGDIDYKNPNSYMDINGNKLEEYTSDTLEMEASNKKCVIHIQAYKYIPGLEYKNGYEGISWLIDMDEWHDFLTNAELGKQKGLVYDSYWGERGQGEYDVVKYGRDKYVVSKYYFHPSASWHYKYQTYDEENNQFVTITLTFDWLKNKNISNDPDVNKNVNQIEDSLRLINSK